MLVSPGRAASGLCGGVWVCGFVFLVAPFAWLSPCGGGGGLVGLLFEICIVDASIN